jgi:enoyl-CoA hydratase/carnithine racemase
MDRLRVLYSHISPLVLYERSPSTLSIKINRPKALNAFNYEILTSITNLVQENPSSTMIFSSTLPKSFCAGGDVNATVENDLIVPEFYRTELMTFFHISQVRETIALMQGFSIGAGNGLAMSCKFRVSTPSTKFSMPENSIGLVPDTGASYFLSHLPSRAVGLYLMVTGKTLSGVDCYWARISTHFVPDEKIKELHDEIVRTGKVLPALVKFAQEPSPADSELLRNIPEIEEIFGNARSVNEILAKLDSKNSEFAKNTFKTICQMCPLSVRVAVKSFCLGEKKSYKECLEQDYGIEVQMCFRRSYNYTTAITKRFIKKEKGDIPWYPSSLNQVTDEMVDVIIANPEGPRLVVPVN